MSQSAFGAQLQAILAQQDAKMNGLAASLRKDMLTVANATRLQSRRDGRIRSLDGLEPGSLPGGLWSAAANGVIRLEDIPGRRRPFTYLCEIPIGASVTSVQSQTILVSQDGPFVATRRLCAFLSQHAFAYTDPDTNAQATFNGRSNGRFRPISSTWDFNDSQHNAIADISSWVLGALNAGAMANSSGVLGMPSSMSSFRTMEFDGYIELRNAGSALPRQNRPVPTAFWASPLGAGIELGALDFFERGEVIEVLVQPTHPQNPNYGNVDGSVIWPTLATPGWPFLDGQFDAHEGIATPGAITNVADNPPEIIANDPMARSPAGILIVALEGYRIDQPPGVPANVQV